MLRLSLFYASRVVQSRNPIPLQSSVVHGYVLRKCHILPKESDHNDSNKPGTKNSAKFVLNNTYFSLSRQLKLKTLTPSYKTHVQTGHNKLRLWKSTLTLKWPEVSSYEGVGRSKKDAEERAAQMALSNLQESRVISSSGKLICDLSQTEREPDHIYTIGPIPTEDYQPSIQDLNQIKETNPGSKGVLLNYYRKVSTELNLPNVKLQPAFKLLKKHRKQPYWQANYHVKWPEPRCFSAIGKTRSEADNYAVLSAMNWLKINGYVYPNGHPVLYSEAELSLFLSNVKGPIQVALPEELTEEFEDLFEEFRTLEPLLNEDRLKRHDLNSSQSIDIGSLEEVVEDGDLDLSTKSSPVNDTSCKYSEEGYGLVFDSITGRNRRPLSQAELNRRNKELFISARQRLIEGVGPTIPYLPIIDKKDEILEQIKNNRVIVLSGGTGCGKSTQIPQYLLDSFALESKGSDCNIIVTQPRRLAAVSLSDTVAGFRAEKVGESIGYQVRLDSVMPTQRTGRILFCSTGILLRRLQTCAELEGISHLIIDEVHERDVLTDFLLVIIKDLLKRNSNLKVILMSASMNAELFSRYFSNAPLITVNGRAFPVKEHFLDNIFGLLPAGNQQHLSHYHSKNTSKPIIDVDLAIQLIRHIDDTKPPEGAILCFLPGWQDIQTIHSKLKDLYPSEETHWILPVHSRLSQKEQNRIFNRPPLGIRKIVLATNIAETSITINDVVYVIDPGVHKQLSYNVQKGSTVIENQWISKANVKQRAGRAGRVQPGESYHLFTKEQFNQMEKFPQSEILRIPLEKVVMDIKAYDENLKAVDFLGRLLEPPPIVAIQDAIEELEVIGALDKEERLTGLGQRIAPFTTHPRLAKALVYGAILGCVNPVANIIAGLNSSREAWEISTESKQKMRDSKRQFHPTSDHLALSNLMNTFSEQHGRHNVNQFCSETGANPKALYFLKGVRSLLIDHLCDAKLLDYRSDAIDSRHPCNINADNEEVVKAALLLGLGDRVCRVQKGCIIKGAIKPDEVVIANDKHGHVALLSDTVNASQKISEEFLMYYNGVYLPERRSFGIRDTSQISSVIALLAAGSSISGQWQNDKLVLSIDRRKLLKFTCTRREAELIINFRRSLATISDYLLRTAGAIEPDRKLIESVFTYHNRQVTLLARLLSSYTPKMRGEE